MRRIAGYKASAVLGLAVVGLAVAGLGAFWLTGAGQAQSNAETGGGFLPYLDAERVASGATVYTSYCASCHGLDMAGEADWRSPDAEGYLPAPPHDQSGHTWHHRDEQLFFTVKYGTEKLVGGSYKSRMGGYEDDLSDEEIIDVLAFIKSRWPASVIKRHNMMNDG